MNKLVDLFNGNINDADKFYLLTLIKLTENDLKACAFQFSEESQDDGQSTEFVEFADNQGLNAEKTKAFLSVFISFDEAMEFLGGYTQKQIEILRTIDIDVIYKLIVDQLHVKNDGDANETVVLWEGIEPYADQDYLNEEDLTENLQKDNGNLTDYILSVFNDLAIDGTDMVEDVEDNIDLFEGDNLAQTQDNIKRFLEWWDLNGNESLDVESEFQVYNADEEDLTEEDIAIQDIEDDKILDDEINKIINSVSASCEILKDKFPGYRWTDSFSGLSSMLPRNLGTNFLEKFYERKAEIIKKISEISGVKYDGNMDDDDDISEFISNSVVVNRKDELSFINKEVKKMKTVDFELVEHLIPESGVAPTLFGELIRACQYILYRYYNDGDCGTAIYDPNFISVLNLHQTLDNIFYDEKLEEYNLIGKYGENIFNFIDNENIILAVNNVAKKLIELYMKDNTFLNSKNTANYRTNFQPQGFYNYE